jgi:hypothetical protein
MLGRAFNVGNAPESRHVGNDVLAVNEPMPAREAYKNYAAALDGIEIWMLPAYLQLCIQHEPTRRAASRPYS